MIAEVGKVAEDFLDRWWSGLTVNGKSKAYLKYSENLKEVGK